MIWWRTYYNTKSVRRFVLRYTCQHVTWALATVCFSWKTLNQSAATLKHGIACWGIWVLAINITLHPTQTFYPNMCTPSSKQDPPPGGHSALPHLRYHSGMARGSWQRLRLGLQTAHVSIHWRIWGMWWNHRWNRDPAPHPTRPQRAIANVSVHDTTELT